MAATVSDPAAADTIAPGNPGPAFLLFDSSSLCGRQCGLVDLINHLMQPGFAGDPGGNGFGNGPVYILRLVTTG